MKEERCLGRIKNRMRMVLLSERGIVLPIVLGIMITLLILSAALITLMPNEGQLASHEKHQTEAFDVAEAGVNYYIWHLAHNATDYDVNGTYEYKDAKGNVVGEYTLTVTPPAAGETTIEVKSEGWPTGHPESKRTIEAVLGVPTFADYAFITNEDVWFGDTEELQGKVHSNGGIRFDGTCNAPVTSAKETYTCQPYHGVNPPAERPGIWGTGGPDNMWMFPVPAVDFEGVSADLADLKDKAQDSGIYLPNTGSGFYGYKIQLLPSHQVKIWKVKKVRKVWGYNGSRWVYEGNDIQTSQNCATYDMPANGIIFVEDKTWVDGNINGDRVNIVAARFPDTPSTNASIIINGHITYNHDDGTDVVGLIAQKDVLVPRYSPSSLEVDAAMLAQKGHCFRYYYPGNILNRITIKGSISSNGVWTWSWVNSQGDIVSGYRNTITVYDSNLTFAPPPSYPTIGQYAILSWKESK